MWKITLPNLPTIIVNLLIFILSIFIMAFAIVSQNIIVGIIALIVSNIKFKFERKNK